MGPMRTNDSGAVEIQQTDSGPFGRLMVSYGKHKQVVFLDAAKLRMLAADIITVAERVEADNIDKAEAS